MEFMPEDTQLNEQDVHQSNMYNIEKNRKLPMFNKYLMTYPLEDILLNH